MIDQEEIHNKCLSNDPEERIKGLEQLEANFSLLPDKERAWNDLHTLTNDESSFVREVAAKALGSAFSQVPYKQKAWNDLVRLTKDSDSEIWNHAALELESVFSYMPNKQKAWSDLVKLTSHEDWGVRSAAINTLTSEFSLMPDKQKAWNDLVKLTSKEDPYVRHKSAYHLRRSFFEVPDKQQAWNDLVKLTNEEGTDIITMLRRNAAALVLCSACFEVPDKEKAWGDLLRLNNDEKESIRHYANYALGKVSIFKASKAENDDDYKIQLENAIDYFEIAAKESDHLSNSIYFCLPFYRSFHSIIFQKQEAKEEVNKYLAEAKVAIEGSKSKKTFFEAVENLAEALKEVQSLENLDLEAKKGELNFYRKYFNRAEELMMETEKTAPFTTIAMRKGLPILDRNIKGILEEIQEKAKIACKKSKGTDAEEIAYFVCREVQKWEIGNQEEMTQKVEDVAYLLKIKVANLPENEYILSKIEAMRQERNLTRQFESLLFVIGQIPTMKVVLEQDLDRKLVKLDHIYDKTISIEGKLDLIQKELDKGLDKLDILSMEVEENEGELIKSFSKEILKSKERRDLETLKSFLEEVLIKQDILINEIEKSSAPPEEKEESKRSILNIRSVIDKVKHPIKSFGKDVTKEIIVTYTAEEIVKLVFQLISMAALGFPIPPQILDIMSNMARELKK